MNKQEVYALLENFLKWSENWIACNPISRLSRTFSKGIYLGQYRTIPRSCRHDPKNERGVLTEAPFLSTFFNFYSQMLDKRQTV